MRLFIAVTFNGEVKRLLLEAQDRLRLLSVKGNFSRPENLHLTLIFLGETPEERLGEICFGMDRVRPDFRAFHLVFSRSGFFQRRAKELWWLGADEGAGTLTLRTLRQKLGERLLAGGFAMDMRPFNVHITLGREIRRGETGTDLVLRAPIRAAVERISLMRSEHVREGGKSVLVYTELYGIDPVQPPSAPPSR